MSACPEVSRRPRSGQGSTLGGQCSAGGVQATTQALRETPLQSLEAPIVEGNVLKDKHPSSSSAAKNRCGGRRSEARGRMKGWFWGVVEVLVCEAGLSVPRQRPDGLDNRGGTGVVQSARRKPIRWRWATFVLHNGARHFLERGDASCTPWVLSGRHTWKGLMDMLWVCLARAGSAARIFMLRKTEGGGFESSAREAEIPLL